MNDHAWLAGVLEQRGSFYVSHPPSHASSGRSPTAYFLFQSNNPELVERVNRILPNAGTVTFREAGDWGEDALYMARCNTNAGPRWFLKHVTPYLTPSRRRAVEEWAREFESMGGAL